MTTFSAMRLERHICKSDRFELIRLGVKLFFLNFFSKINIFVCWRVLEFLLSANVSTNFSALLVKKFGSLFFGYIFSDFGEPGRRTILAS